MNRQIDISKHPYGLGGGTVLSGSVSVAGEGFWYYPVTQTVATVKVSNLNNALGSVTYTAGVGVYGNITEVTQSSGVAVLYSGSANTPTYTFGSSS